MSSVWLLVSGMLCCLLQECIAAWEVVSACSVSRVCKDGHRRSRLSPCLQAARFTVPLWRLVVLLAICCLPLVCNYCWLLGWAWLLLCTNKVDWREITSVISLVWCRVRRHKGITQSVGRSVFAVFNCSEPILCMIHPPRTNQSCSRPISCVSSVFTMMIASLYHH